MPPGVGGRYPSGHGPVHAREPRPVSYAWLAALGVVAAVAVAVTALLLVRRRSPEGGWFADGDRAAGTFGMLSTGFAILLGFVVFLAFESFDASRVGAEAEAVVVAQQVETAQFLPVPARQRLVGELVCYARHVVGEEWPRMEDGERPDEISPWSARLFRTLTTVAPEGAVEETAYAKWFDQTNDREVARNDRIHGAEGVIPSPLWAILVLGGAVVIGYMLMFADRSERPFVQGAQIGAVVAVVGATLAVVGFLDQPFRATVGGLQPVAMERSLVLIEQSLRAVGEDVAPPCDARGRPVA